MASKKSNIEPNIFANLNIPKGVTIQSRKQATEQYTPPSKIAEDELLQEQDDFEGEYDEELGGEDDFFEDDTAASSTDTTTPALGLPKGKSGNLHVDQRSEEDFQQEFGEDEGGYMSEEEYEDHNTEFEDLQVSDQSDKPKPSPVLPPGVTFGRKAPIAEQNVSTTRPIQLPPGISFSKKTLSEPLRMPSQAQSTGSPLGQGRPPLINTPKIQQFGPKPVRPQATPQVRWPGRAPTPRKPASIPSDFLEQKMQIGGSGDSIRPTRPRGRKQPQFSPRGPRVPRTPNPSVFPKWPQPPRMPQPRGRPPLTGTRQISPIVPLAPGKQTRPFKSGELESNIRLQKSQPPAKHLPNLPPGISLKGKTPAIDPFSYFKDQKNQNNLTPKGKSLPPKVLPKVPAGITLQQRKQEPLPPIEEKWPDDDIVSEPPFKQPSPAIKPPVKTAKVPVRIPPPVDEEDDELEDPDLIEDFKMMQAQFPMKQTPGPKLPPGVTLQQKKAEQDNDSWEDDEDVIAEGSIAKPAVPKIPPGVTIQPKKPEPRFLPGARGGHDEKMDKQSSGFAKSESPKLPPGITLQQKSVGQPSVPKAPLVNQVSSTTSNMALEDVDDEIDEDIDEFEDELLETGDTDEFPDNSSIQSKVTQFVEDIRGKPSPAQPIKNIPAIPKGITVQSRKSDMSSPQEIKNDDSNRKSKDFIPPYSPLPKVPAGVNIGKVMKESTKPYSPKKSNDSIQLPAGISFGRNVAATTGDDHEDDVPENEGLEDDDVDMIDNDGTENPEADVEEGFEPSEEAVDGEPFEAEDEVPSDEDKIVEDASGFNEEPAEGELNEEFEEFAEAEDQSTNEPDVVPKLGEIDFESLISPTEIDRSGNVGSPSHEPVDDEKLQDNEKDVMQNLVDMMTKGEIEGEIEDEGCEEKEEEKKKGGKRKADDLEGSGDESKEKKSKDDLEDFEEDEEGEDADGEPIDKSKVTGTHLRKNIREVMDETKLDEATLAAQRQEAERLKRLQDQQKIIREVQRQIQMSKQSQKQSARGKVMNLLQGNSQTSILKTSSSTQNAASIQSRASDTVSLKMGNGQQANLSEKMRELLKGPGKSLYSEPNTSSLLRQGMVSSSVTIAPIKKEFAEKKKVVTLSSDSDDDCIVLSDEEVESEPEEDPTNSGMHTADRYNVPDDQGRVLVNTGHPPGEPDVYLAPQIARIIKPHQIGGIRFLFDNIIESVDRYNHSSGFGCILAHSMGLGKTLQIVSFSDIFLRHTSGKKILVIMPINTIQNWMSEFNMWVPKENNQNQADAEVRCREFNVFVVNESLKNIHSRGKVILDWHKNGGVLLMGYELFRLLSLKKPIKSKRKRPDEIEEEKNRELVEEIYQALVRPGPDLVICDEGHRIKNSHATTSQALKQIKTRRRVVLTGYPLQNNLLEYWCMVDFVRPNYLGSKTEFSNMFERPIQNGQCIDSTPQDKRLMRYRAHVLHSLLEGFVQRRSHSVLQEVLPHKEEYVLLLRFTAFQRKLYDTFMNDVVRVVAVPNPLKAFAVCCKIWNHPDVLFNFLKKKGEQIDLDLEETLHPPLNTMNALSPAAAASGVNIPPSMPWPKRGPGSRGGKVRQSLKKKARTVPPVPVQKTPEKAPTQENILPSMSQFAVQSGNSYNSSGMPDFQSNNYQQPNYFQQQQQQPSEKTGENYQYQQNNYNNQNMYNEGQKIDNEQKMFDDFSVDQQKMFDKDQKNYGDVNSEYNANFGGDAGFQGQTQYPQQTDNSQFGQSNVQQQYYGQNDASVSSSFDYNQSTNDMNDFSQLSGFPDGGFDNATFPNSNSSDFQQQQQQQNYWGNNWPSCSTSGGGAYSGGSSSDEFMSPPKFTGYEGERKEDQFPKQVLDFGDAFGMNAPKMDSESEEQKKMPPPMSATTTPVKSDMEDSIKKEDVPYDWATELFKNYVAGVIENSSKMEVFFMILNESLKKQDRILVFSQSLLTLDLIEEYLQRRKIPGREENWAKNRSYFRLDGSTPALEREKLINEFNASNNVLIFLVSTRAGSLGINLVGANRVVVFDASWNPCHDTQAVCRVYRYGQKKRCYVYRLVMDCCLERKIYDRQINKQGMADRVVDELNPDAHLSIKEVTNLCWDDLEETTVKDFSDLKDRYKDDIIKTLVVKHSTALSKAPFQHESLLVDRKEKKLSQAEKRLAKRSYELEKQAANQPRSLYQFLPSTGSGRGMQKPIASVKPMQNERFGSMPPRSKWITADVWQKQGMTAQEMTLPLDVVIPTNSPDKTSIVLKAGQRVMVLKSPKGIYMQLETGKIIAIRTAFKVGQSSDKTDDRKGLNIASALKNNPNVTVTQKSSHGTGRVPRPSFLKPSSLDKKAAAINMAASKGRIAQKNRPMPFSRKLQPVSAADKERFQISSQQTEDLTKASEITREDASKDSSDESADIGDALGLFSEESSFQGSTNQQKEDSSRIPPMGPEQPADNKLGATGQMMSESDAWGDVNMGQDLANDSLNSMRDLAKAQGLGETLPTPVSDDKKSVPAQGSYGPVPYNYPSDIKDAVEVKKEEDNNVRSWPMNHPYGSYYPGYYGYGPPMPGYEGFPPYPPNYPPPVPMKQEASDGKQGTPPPTGIPPGQPPAAPPMYPPYHNPYPYYNYPPYPPQGQPAAGMPGTPKSESNSNDAAPFPPPPPGPYNAQRPPFPSGPGPGYYPNYPPYRPPFPDPNYPYPNYNPYMHHPPGYGYPMQTPPQGAGVPQNQQSQLPHQNNGPEAGQSNMGQSTSDVSQT